MNRLEWYSLINRLLSGNIDFVGVIIYILSSLAVIFLTLPVHEFAHGFAATKLGDPTPRYQERMTLNPFAHIDWIGAACILLFGFGWAKPVQVNSNNFRNPKRDMAVTALAGPLSNLIVAFAALLINNILSLIALKTLVSAFYYIGFFFYYIALINVSLAVFNLIPIPPLDGSRLLSAFLPYRYYYALMRYERYIFFGLIALLWIGVLDIPLNFLSGAVMSFLKSIAGLPFKLIFRINL